VLLRERPGLLAEHADASHTTDRMRARRGTFGLPGPGTVVPAQKVQSTAKRRVSEIGEASWGRSRYTGERAEAPVLEPPGWSNGFLIRARRFESSRGHRDYLFSRGLLIHSRPLDAARESTPLTGDAREARAIASTRAGFVLRGAMSSVLETAAAAADLPIASRA
jgi:hypothetical protein